MSSEAGMARFTSSHGMEEAVDPLSADARAISRSLADPSEFQAVFDRHYRAIHGYLLRLVAADVAEELAAETFLVAFQKRRRFRLESTSARPWLFGIATNLFRRHARRNARMWRAHLRHEMSAQIASSDPWLAADQRVDAAALASALAAALARLRPADRDVLLLYALEHLTYEEVAAVLGIPVGTVRSRLSRARGVMRELLPRHRAIVDDDG